MVNKSKNTGTAWESEVVSALLRYMHTTGEHHPLESHEQSWPHVERRALQGTLDKGDISGIPGCMIECKAEKKIDLASYAKEVEVQTKNANADIGVAWIKRPRKGTAEDGYVVMSGSMFMKLLAEAGY